MVKKISSLPYFEKLLNISGGWYPILMLLIMQIVNSPLIILLTALPAQDNANFSQIQSTSLLKFASVAMLFRNVILLVQFYLGNKDLLSSLEQFKQTGAVANSHPREKRVWRQANTASKRYLVTELLALLVFVLAPTLTYGITALEINHFQIIYLSLAAITASLVNLILETLVIDQWFKPVIKILLPKQFEIQLIGLKGMRLGTKFTFAIIGLAMISFLLTVPQAYNQVNLVFKNIYRSPELLTNALLIIIKASVGAIVVGLILAFGWISYFSSPLKRMIEMFRKVEKGDLSQRIEVIFSDEFGELYIYLNHMIERLQTMTSSLEQQVSERTAQLSYTNEQLTVELAERKRMEEQLAYSAVHDPLTNLPNRVLFMDRLHHAMERTRRHKNFKFAVIFIDLDHFKVVNDSLGHNVGDLLLTEISRRLEECVRAEDTVARLGGDEFVILLEDLESPTDYLRVVKRIQTELAAPANLEGFVAFISTSMGIVLNNERYNRPEDILRDADIAMYHAKRQGRGRYEVFDPQMLAGVMTRLQLETELRKALERNEFLVYYQPIVDLETQHIAGFEALVRWQHPRRGLLLPAEFIPLAEEIGLIVPIGYRVLDEACRQIHVWQRQFPSDPPLTMNVNLSPRQCAEKDLIEKIVEILQKNQVNAHDLKLELTESLVLQDSAHTATILSKLRALGIQVNIDDFGTGYSSLGHLQTLPIDTLKIDHIFISQLGNTTNGSEIVQMIMTLAHSLGMKVIAEGVETDDQLSILKSMDCEYVQGFLLAKPHDSQETEKFLGKYLGKKQN